MKNQIQKTRLLKLALHLSHICEKRTNDSVFMIRMINTNMYKIPFFQNALRESIVIYPEDFEIVDNEVVWKEDYTEPASTLVTAMKYYGLNLKQIDHCFSADYGLQNFEKYGGRLLTVNSNYNDIAYNIISMLQKIRHEPTDIC